MQIEGGHDAALQFRAQLHHRGDFRIQRLGIVVAVMVVRRAEFSLVAVFHAVLVHERDGDHFPTGLPSAAHVVLRQHRGQEPFHRVRGHRLTAVMAGRQQHDPRRPRRIEAAGVQPFDRAVLAAAAQLVHATAGWSRCRASHAWR